MSVVQEHGYTVEPFQISVDDPTEIAQLHLEVRRHQEATDNNVFSDIYETQIDLNAIGSFYIEPGGNFFVARANSGDIAGFVGVRHEEEVDLGSIKRMAVMIEHRRRGIGLALAQTAVAWSRENGFSRLQLSTGFKENAKPIYEKVGFVVVGTKNDKDWLMEMEL